MNQISVAIISDTHSVIHPQIEVLIGQCDVAIHAGDICNGEVLNRMRPKSGEVYAVRGNNDLPATWPAEQKQQIDQIPEIQSLNLPGGVLKVEHGHRHDMVSPDHEDLRAAHPEARMVVYGHTHKKVIDDYKTPWVVNPGAAGDTRTRGGASCLILNASETSWNLISYRFD